jgi:hypothetical protein
MRPLHKVHGQQRTVGIEVDVRDEMGIEVRLGVAGLDLHGRSSVAAAFVGLMLWLALQPVRLVVAAGRRSWSGRFTRFY